MNRDDSANLVNTVINGPIAMSADPTPAAIDLIGADSNTILIAVGVGGITFSGADKIEFKLTHCDTEDGTYTAVTDSDVVLGTNADASVGTGGIVKSLIAAHAAASITKVGYIGGKRYLKVLPDFSGTHGAATPICVSLLQTRLKLHGTS